LTKIVLDDDKENCSNEAVKSIEYLKHELAISKITINLLNEKLESNNNARLQLDHHVQGLNQQIDELLGKIKGSNIRHCENTEKITSLHSTVSALEHVSC